MERTDLPILERRRRDRVPEGEKEKKAIARRIRVAEKKKEFEKLRTDTPGEKTAAKERRALREEAPGRGVQRGRVLQLEKKGPEKRKA